MPSVSSHESAIVLLSGGLDSCVSLAQALTTYTVVRTVFIDYGQRARDKERSASEAVAQHYGLPYQVIDCPWLIPPAALVQNSRQSLSPAEDSTAQVWVPNRNGVLLNLAASLAEACGATVVIFGANADEGQGFPDNTPAFREAINASLAFSTLAPHVRVVCPVEHLSKPELVALGQSLNAPLHLVWSCYDNQDTPCGQCLSCQHHARGMAAVG